MQQRTLNLGILAHVDAGKTTLTERLLFAAGVIDRPGSVDAGTTQTDTLELERQRGITIKSAVVAFAIGDVAVNLIDTPGHPDFIAEVERALEVLDGAVLVVSAVEGVQPQTRIIMRALQRIGVPTVFFVNKVDRRGADYERTLGLIAERLTPRAVSMGSVRSSGTREAEFVPSDRRGDTFAHRLAEVLGEHDDTLLRAYLDAAGEPPLECLLHGLAAQAMRGHVHPVFAGSALTGAGVAPLMSGIARFLPSTERSADGPLSGRVFKITRGPAGERVALARVFSGSLATRDRVRCGTRPEQKLTAVSVLTSGSSFTPGRAMSGDVARLCGLDGIRVGDEIGAVTGDVIRQKFAPPSLETVILPRRSRDKGALQAALGQLAEQDPLINLRQDDARNEIYVSLFGEVQKEVIAATLAADFGVEVDFRETTTICVERPRGSGEALERNRAGGNPFLATIGLRIEPRCSQEGVEFHLAQEVLGTMPIAFFRAVESSVHRTLREGLYGWPVTDCAVTMTHTGYSPRQSHAHQGFSKAMSSTGEDFRGLTPLVVMTALKRAGTVVCEPIHRFHLEVPGETVGAVLPALARLRALSESTVVSGLTANIEGTVPAAQVAELRRQLPSLSHGEGVIETSFGRYDAVEGRPPRRPRTDDNPLDRTEYLLRVTRRRHVPSDDEESGC